MQAGGGEGCQRASHKCNVKTEGNIRSCVTVFVKERNMPCVSTIAT